MTKLPENLSPVKNSAKTPAKAPPHSIEAEQSVLGALMLEDRAWDLIADRISVGDFYRSNHRLIFEVMTQLSERSQPFDVITIAEELKKQQQLASIGGEGYLFELAHNTPSAANIKAYADIVRKYSILRQLARVGTDIAESAFNFDGDDSKHLLDEAERQVLQIAQHQMIGSGPVPISRVLGSTIQRIDTLFHSGQSVTGLATGFIDFDNLTSGLQKSDLIVIAGRPSMGKTAFAMNIAEYAAVKQDQPVLVFSLEMPAESLVMRMLSSLGRIDQHKLRTGKLTEDDWTRIHSNIILLSNTKLYIDDTPALTPSDVRSRARRVARENNGLGLIVLDYLQLMRVPGYKDNRVAEISEISRSLKTVAKELNVPFIALSQLNRSLEQRTDRRPVMSDLRESGAIEQDADLIAFIYRDEVYHPDSDAKNQAEIIIRKQRNGPIGDCRLTFRGQYTKFENFANDQLIVEGYV